MTRMQGAYQLAKEAELIGIAPVAAGGVANNRTDQRKATHTGNRVPSAGRVRVAEQRHGIFVAYAVVAAVHNFKGQLRSVLLAKAIAAVQCWPQ